VFVDAVILLILGLKLTFLRKSLTYVIYQHISRLKYYYSLNKVNLEKNNGIKINQKVLKCFDSSQ